MAQRIWRAYLELRWRLWRDVVCSAPGCWRMCTHGPYCNKHV